MYKEDMREFPPPPSSTSSEVRNIPIQFIDANPYQPRQVFDQDKLQHLAENIKQEGILQPVILIQDNDRFTLVAGERRVRAAKLAGISAVPAIVKDLSKSDTLRIALIENIQRDDLNALEEAMAYRILIKHFGYTQEQCAKKVGRDRSSVSNIIRLLSLPTEIKTDLLHKRLSAGHCRALLSLPSRELMLEARKIILKKDLNVRQSEILCKSLPIKPDKTTKTISLDAEMEQLVTALRERLKTKVRVAGSSNKGKIEISYFSSAELDRILALIGYTS